MIGIMEDFRSIVARFPERELDIRRRCTLDAEFRQVCSDYGEATAALHYWREIGDEGHQKVEEYRSFIQELEAEILLHLDRQFSMARRP